ncbi:MAG: DUF4249 family protein [Bacteroidetes bacterium]|nr:DUF4249 family protein [Bacteroidota bacterium]
MIKNAYIDLYVNGNFKEKLLFNNKAYISNYTPKTNDHLKIFSSTQTYDTINAEATIPNKTLINNEAVEFTKNGFIDKEGFLNDLIKFQFEDPANTENFYEAFISFTVETDSTINTYQPYLYYSNNPIIENEDQLIYELRSILFSDELFDGKTAFIDIAFEKHYINNNERIKQTRLIFMSISKEYYLYKKSRSLSSTRFRIKFPKRNKMGYTNVEFKCL